ncbi:MAG: hypothetical protein HYR51_19070 [Candidatus Rokubacteria bacterium]|nr:hypothetical protein [Candidatus Rokubacteria bacterium]
MTLRDSLLRASVEPLADGTVLALDPGFQGLPGMAHGGTVLALFDAVAGHAGPRRVRGHYMKKVPLGADLTLRREAVGAGVKVALDAGSTRVVDGIVSAAAPAATPRPKPPAPHAAHPLPLSTSCFVCGVQNPLGLHAALGFDDETVHGVWRPRETVRAADGTLAPIALTALLDEAAFWLGALATGESGMTTELEVTLLRPVPFGEPVTIAGDRSRVAPRADARYAETEVTAFAPDGTAAATARITFVAVRGAARRLAGWLAQTNAPDVIRRVFPTYAK